MTLLVISLVALVIGPLLYGVADKARSTLAALDGFVMVAVTGLVLVHIIPHSLESAGPWALALALAGFLGPGFVEHRLRTAARQAHAAALVLALGGLVVHAVFDGAALAGSGHGGHDTGSALALAVALHRLPIAITIWSLLRGPAGRNWALSTLVALGGGTLLGYGGADAVLHHLGSSWVGYLQALVAGSLLHVVIHRPSLAQPNTARQRAYAGVAAIAAAAMVAMLADSHLAPDARLHALPFGSTFVALALETAPALLVAFALAGMMQVFLPRATLRWLRTGRPMGEAMRGVAFGLPLPICSCGVIPLYRTLVTQGVPASAAMAFLVATPELGLDAVLISLPLLGADLALARVIGAAVVAVTAGWVVGRVAGRSAVQPPAVEPAAQVRGSLRSRLRTGLRFGFSEIVDHTGPWLLVGVALAALAGPLLRAEWLDVLPRGADVALFALIGMPMYVCASGATPLAAVLIFKGVSPGAAIAFLLAGPATNVTTFGVLSSLHGRKVAALFGGTIAVLSIGLGLTINAVLGDAMGMALGQAVHESGTTLEVICLGVLALVFAASIIRQGPRIFVDQVLSPYDGDDDHDHGHGDHGHDDHGHDDDHHH